MRKEITLEPVKYSIKHLFNKLLALGSILLFNDANFLVSVAWIPSYSATEFFVRVIE